jgi:hypothetical protein
MSRSSSVAVSERKLEGANVANEKIAVRLATAAEVAAWEEMRESFHQTQINPNTNRAPIPTYTILGRTFHGHGTRPGEQG